MMSRRLEAFTKSSSFPPTIKERVPSSAPLTPPETGASNIDIPTLLALLATRLLVSGLMVEESIIKVVLARSSRREEFK